jgi:putative RecB family exonuclease
MTVDTILKEREEEVIPKQRAYLSYSRINKYLHCPEQYRLYYVENLRPRIPSASLVFGQIIHKGLEHLLRNQGDSVKWFLEAWNAFKEVDLRYSQKESWEKLHAIGWSLLEKFEKEELPRLGKVRGTEKVFELNITSLPLPLVGVIDLVTEMDRKMTVVDFKTAASAYEEHEVILSDQLTTYQLAEPEAEQTALCVLVKTKEPRIEWHVSKRNPEMVIEYLDKVHYVAEEIAAGRFYKRPGKWCGYCDYLPVCIGDKKKTEETLMEIEISS